MRDRHFEVMVAVLHDESLERELEPQEVREVLGRVAAEPSTTDEADLPGRVTCSSRAAGVRWKAS